MSFRQRRLSTPIFAWASKAVPELSPEERVAVASGALWWEHELFSGDPDWNRLLALLTAKLTADEQAFLDAPVVELCTLLHDGRAHPGADAQSRARDFMCERKFFGMGIPREYGGLGFSDAAVSEVVRKVSSASASAGRTLVAASESGLAELLLRSGTEEQRRSWLPRLAAGSEIACSSPRAGIAAEGTCEGVVGYSEQGEGSVLGIHLTLAPNSIPLAPGASVAIVTFTLLDPQGLLGRGENLGTTAALLPGGAVGVRAGDPRHSPLPGIQQGAPRGDNAFIPLDGIIGGIERAGRASEIWAASKGGGLLLTSQAAATAAYCARVAGAYARLRNHGGSTARPQEAERHLADLGANAYQIDAARRLSLATLQGDGQPAVLSAAIGAQSARRMRESLLAACDLLGSDLPALGPEGISRPSHKTPSRALAIGGAGLPGVQSSPFGQSILRAHPHLPQELLALSAPTREEGLRQFDNVVWSHFNRLLRNTVLAFVRGWTGGLSAPAPERAAFTGHWRQLSRYASAFALLADLSLLTQSLDPRRREALAVRLGDFLSELYFLAAALRRFESEGRPEADRPILEYVLQTGYSSLGLVFTAVLENLTSRWAATLVRLVAFPLGVPRPVASDNLVSEVAEILTRSSSQRDRLTPDLYLGEGLSEHPLVALEQAFDLSSEAEPIMRKLRGAGLENAEEGLRSGVITLRELDLLNKAKAAVARVVSPGAFTSRESEKPWAEKTR